jgi:hypothetical protein
MLQRIEAKVSQTGGVSMAIDAEDSALIAKLVWSYFQDSLFVTQTVSLRLFAPGVAR